MLPDFVSALARKWCLELWGSHGGTERDISFEDCNTCRVIAAAICEALEQDASQVCPLCHCCGEKRHDGDGPCISCATTQREALAEAEKIAREHDVMHPCTHVPHCEVAPIIAALRGREK